MTVRTRFAPSPTGQVHIGNIRTAIFAWLFARHEGGKFLLRVEDTDRERSTPEAVQAVLSAMEWLGLGWDEPPVYQSQRTAAHQQAAEDLLSRGFAYKEDKGGTGRGKAVVFRMPGRNITFHDEVRGDLTKKAEDLRDFVIVRSDGTPVFHLANVVDDLYMGITHVIRGDDHIENTFRHIALFEAFGAMPPKYAHLPMIVNAQGKPYSKRDGAAYVGEFRDRGFLADALFNYLALLGWSPGDDREIMTRQELISAFSLSRVQKSPARFDLAKLEWINGVYMRALPREQLIAGCRAAMERMGVWRDDISSEYFAQVVEVMGERIHFFDDVARRAAYFFTEDYSFEDVAVRKRLLREGALDGLRKMRERFAALPTFTAKETERALRQLAQELGVGAGALVHPVRVAVSGCAEGPSLFPMLEVLGPERVLQRLDRVLARFSGKTETGLGGTGK